MKDTLERNMEIHRKSMIPRIEALIRRLEDGALQVNDILGRDDLIVMAFIGHPSGIVTDSTKLLHLLQEKLKVIRE